jgi:hypothetical protein
MPLGCTAMSWLCMYPEIALCLQLLQQVFSGALHLAAWLAKPNACSLM